jgi:Starch-binding associating with outer membrane
MKTNGKLARAVAAGLLAAGAAGCSEGLTDLNENPNEPTRVGAEYLFTNATEAAVSRALGSGLHMDLTALWVQHYGEMRYTEEDRYELRDPTVNTHWSGFYAGPLQDFNEVVTQGDTLARPNVKGMGMVMRSWTFQIVTDLWGDVGYTEALQGRTPGSPTTVKYDPQQAVYQGLLSELAAAQGLFDPAGYRMGAADLIYQGDPAKWKRFANSLRLRVAMRMSQADANTARAAFQAAMAAGVFTSNADNAVLNYVDNGIDVHPIFASQRTAPTHGVSATIVDSLRALSDPRLGIYANRNAGGNYRGEIPASQTDVSLDSISRIGTFFSRANAPSYLMTYAEVLFLQAEAAERGWITGDAAALYRAAITAHLQMVGVPAADITTYLARPRVAYAGLPSIGLQKWIALYGNGPEAYAEWRRTGHPNLRAGPDALNEGRIPVRLPYPTSEQSLNNAALQEAITRQGGNTLNTPVWWDR